MSVEYGDFTWDAKSTPLASPKTVIISCLTYLAGIWLLRSLLSRPLKVNRAVPALHNANLCLGSLAMFLGASWEIYKVLAFKFCRPELPKQHPSIC